MKGALGTVCHGKTVEELILAGVLFLCLSHLCKGEPQLAFVDLSTDRSLQFGVLVCLRGAGLPVPT